MIGKSTGCQKEWHIWSPHRKVPRNLPSQYSLPSVRSQSSFNTGRSLSGAAEILGQLNADLSCKFYVALEVKFSNSEPSGSLTEHACEWEQLPDGECSYCIKYIDENIFSAVLRTLEIALSLGNGLVSIGSLESGQDTPPHEIFSRWETLCSSDFEHAPLLQFVFLRTLCPEEVGVRQRGCKVSNSLVSQT